jgi:2-polyprenyl-3-methyl-5-hydroxy-6-metoxy-1,4-benzoquinol methylase
MPDFSIRSMDAEIMDDLEYSGKMMDRTLYELEFINKWLGGNDVTLGGIKQMVKNHDPKETICIADLGCGRGDILRLISQWAKKENRKVRLIGIDANPYIIEAARTNLSEYPDIELRTMNIFAVPFQLMKFDIVLGTLFYHHFSNQQLQAFFRQLKDQVRIGFIINDIHRHVLAFYSIRLLTRYFSRSSMVKFDAPLSVLKAFKRKELIEILRNAGAEIFTIQWKWAFRWQVLVLTSRN